MNKVIFAAIFSVLLSGCSHPDEAARVLSSQGFTEIKTTGFSFFGCADEDVVRTGFIARSQNGRVVEGVVCSGVLKGATVRFN